MSHQPAATDNRQQQQHQQHQQLQRHHHISSVAASSDNRPGKGNIDSFSGQGQKRKREENETEHVDRYSQHNVDRSQYANNRPVENGVKEESSRRENSNTIDQSTTTSHSSLCWNEAHHRDFVEAVFKIGLVQASPSVILENMIQKPPALTSERVKSHLQKYRNHKEKSTLDFMKEYDKWMDKALMITAASAGSSDASNDRCIGGRAVAEMVGSDNLMGGDLAAYLAFSVLSDETSRPTKSASNEALHISIARNVTEQVLSPKRIRSGSQEFAEAFSGSQIPFPSLTKEERESELGIWFGHTLSLFYSMNHQLVQQRRKLSAQQHRSAPMKQPAEGKTTPVSPSARSALAAALSMSPLPDYIQTKESAETKESADEESISLFQIATNKFHMSSSSAHEQHQQFHPNHHYDNRVDDDAHHHARYPPYIHQFPSSYVDSTYDSTQYVYPYDYPQYYGPAQQPMYYEPTDPRVYHDSHGAAVAHESGSSYNNHTPYFGYEWSHEAHYDNFPRDHHVEYEQQQQHHHHHQQHYHFAVPPYPSTARSHSARDSDPQPSRVYRGSYY